MKETKKGFTLIELVVVMAIIAILSVIIVGAILAARTAATNTQRTGSVRTIETALEARAARCNGFYFKVDTASTVCSVLDSTNLATLVANLKTKQFLTLDVPFDDPTKFVITAPRKDGTCTYVAGVGTAVETCDGTSQGVNTYKITAVDNSYQTIYSASR